MSVTSYCSIGSVSNAAVNNVRHRSGVNATRAHLQRWICTDCRIGKRARGTTARTTLLYRYNRRQLSTSQAVHDEAKVTAKLGAPSATLSPHTSDKDLNHDITAETRDSLPSQADSRRWDIERRMSRMMESVLARASIYSQHINAYTGTDYSGIEVLKKRIVDQEEKVRECHKSIEATRSANHEAHERQDISQKEIVALLERKSSWTPSELERYMSLVRSEHANEQAVQAAKEDLTVSERELEEARAKLERLERKQYHEEQIWSDTIRRNSTWVTFGLMGLNIILLLAQIGVFEPYRRRRIVREVQKALDEKMLGAPQPSVEKQIDEVLEPSGVAIEQVEASASRDDGLDSALDAMLPESQADNSSFAADEILPDATTRPAGTQSEPPDPPAYRGRWDTYKESFQDLFSERIVQLKKVDVTTTALQGAATGVAAMGLLFVVFRPR